MSETAKKKIILQDNCVDLWDPKSNSASKSPNTTRLTAILSEEPSIIRFYKTSTTSSSLENNELFSIYPPFRYSVIPSSKEFPSHLRIFTEIETEDETHSSICFILFPSLPIDEWISSLRIITFKFAILHSPFNGDRSHIRIYSSDAKRVLTNLPLLNYSTISQALDFIVNKQLGEIPTLYTLNFSPSSLSSVYPLLNFNNWTVSDTNPINLKSFAGESLYLIPKINNNNNNNNQKPNHNHNQIISNALEQWVGSSLSLSSDQPNSVTCIKKWSNASEEQRDFWKKGIAFTLSKLSCPLIDLFYSQTTLPLQFRVSPTRIHEIGSNIELVFGTNSFIDFEFRVTNIDKEQQPLRILLELPSEKQCGGNIIVSCNNPIQLISPGEIASFAIRFTLNSQQPQISEPQIHKKLLFISFVSCNSKTASFSDVPFIIPFTLSIKRNSFTTTTTNLELPMSLCPRHFEPFSIVDGICPLYHVTFEGQPMILKQVKIPPNNSKNPITWEMIRNQLSMVLSLSKNDNIIHIEKYFVDDEENQSLFLLFKDYSHGRNAIQTLRNVLFSEDQTTPKITWQQIGKILIDIATGIDYVQKKIGVSYGELTPDSILIVPTQGSSNTTSLHAILSNFGTISSITTTTTTTNNFQLTKLSNNHLEYVHVTSPEIIAKRSLITECGNGVALITATKSSDIFDFGMIIYYLICRTSPFSDTKSSWKDRNVLEMRILNEARPSLTLIPNDCPVWLKNLMVRCWEGITTSRPSLQEIIDVLTTSDFTPIPSPRSRESSLTTTTTTTLAEAVEAHKHDNTSSGTSSPLCSIVSTTTTKENENGGKESRLTGAQLQLLNQGEKGGLPHSSSVDSVWELLNLPEPIASPRTGGGNEHKSLPPPGSPAALASSPYSRNQTPPQQSSHHRKGSGTSIMSFATTVAGNDQQQSQPPNENGTQNVKFKITLPDGTKKVQILTPTDTIARLMKKLGFTNCELVYQRSKETFSEKMLSRARQIRSSHSILVDICPISDIRDIKVTVFSIMNSTTTATANSQNGNGTPPSVGWERQDHVDAGWLHITATSKEILRAIYHKKRDFSVKENLLLLNGRVLALDATPLKNAPISNPALTAQNPDQVELIAVQPSLIVNVFVHYSQVSLGKETNIEMRFWKQATISQLRQNISNELDIPINRTVLTTQDWGMLAKLDLTLGDYVAESTIGSTLNVQVSSSVEAVEVLVENCGSCLVELTKDSTVSGVKEKGAEYLGCFAEQLIVCSTSGAIISNESKVTSAMNPLVMLQEDGSLRATIGGKGFAFSMCAGPVTIDSLMRTIDKELILIYRGCIHPDSKHVVVSDGVYSLEYIRQTDLAEVSILSSRPSSGNMSSVANKVLLRMHVVRSKTTVNDVAQYTALQLGIQVPSLHDKDSGASLSSDLPFTRFPTVVSLIAM